MTLSGTTGIEGVVLGTAWQVRSDPDATIRVVGGDGYAGGGAARGEVDTTERERVIPTVRRTRVIAT